MEISFVPLKLREARKIVEIQHKSESENISCTLNDDLENLIFRIVSLKPEQAKLHILALTDSELIKIATYIPYNYYEVDMDNLFLIYKYRSSNRLCEILYSQWQNSFDRVDCNKFMRTLVEDNKDYRKVLDGHHLSENMWTNIICSRNMVLEFCDIFSRENGGSLTEQASYYGIKENSILYKKIEFFYYVFCSRDVYMSCQVDKLVNVLEKYIDEDRKNKNNRIVQLFLCNIVSRLTLADLEKFTKVGVRLKICTGEYDTEKFDDFFFDIEYDIKNKYRRWLINIGLGIVFGNDARSRFWKRFDFNKAIYNKKKAIYLFEFENHYALEFTQESLGRLYIFDKSEFESSIRRYYQNYSNTELRSFLYNHQEYCMLSKVHNPDSELNGWRHGWQVDVQAFLLGHKITKLIDFNQ